MRKELLRVENLCGGDSPLRQLSGAWLNLFTGQSLGLYGLYEGAPSALMDMICGKLHPSHGRILVNGQRIGMLGEENAHKHGIYRICKQEQLINSLSVAENIFLLRNGGLRSFWLRRGMINQQASRLLLELGIEISVDGLVACLTTAQKHLIAIAKAVGLGGCIILFDYAFSSYTQNDFLLLDSLLHRLRARGISFIINSNSIEEIRLFCDEVIFFRNDSISKKIETSHLRQLDIPNYLGAGVVETSENHTCHEAGDEVFRFRDSTAQPCLAIDIPVYHGNVTTVVCADQFMRESLFMALSGQRRTTTAKVTCRGKLVRNYHLVSTRSKYRIAAILPPQDTSVFFDKLSTVENLLIPSLRKASGLLGTIPRGLYHLASTDSPTLTNKSVDNMTHHEQISLSFERWLIYHPTVAILYEPFLVSDVVTCELVKRYITQLAAGGTGVLIITARQHRVADISDKVVTL